jgi:hypothetical protein
LTGIDLTFLSDRWPQCVRGNGAMDMTETTTTIAAEAERERPGSPAPSKPLDVGTFFRSGTIRPSHPPRRALHAHVAPEQRAVARRHPDESQRAMVAAKIANMGEG